MKELLLVLYAQGQYDQAAYAISRYMERNSKSYDVVCVEENRFNNFGWGRIRRILYRFTARNFSVFNGLCAGVRQGSRESVEHKKKDRGGQKRKDGDLECNDRSKTVKADYAAPVVRGSETRKNAVQGGDTKSVLSAKFNKLDNVFKRFDPSAVLCLTPASHLKALAVRKKLGMRMPIFALMGDYCINRSFLAEATDAYLVQNEIMAQALQTKGIAPEQISVVGTPLTDDYAILHDKREILKNWGIENGLPVVVLTGGRYGAAALKEAFSTLADYSDRVNLVVLTNGSETLIKYIQSLCKAHRYDRNIVLLDRLTEMSRVYSAADVMVTSPTAYVTYESFMRKVPCVLIKDMNLIEKGNYAFLTSSGLALRGAAKEELVSSVLNLLNNREYYEECAAKAAALPSNGTCTLCRVIQERMRNSHTEELHD